MHNEIYISCGIRNWYHVKSRDVSSYYIHVVNRTMCVYNMEVPIVISLKVEKALPNHCKRGQLFLSHNIKLYIAHNLLAMHKIAHGTQHAMYSMQNVLVPMGIP